VLPANFQFNQNNLQDFVDCPRRFELKYLLRQPWPAIQSEPANEAEQHIEKGARFHRLVQQSKSGISNEMIMQQLESPDLRTWWKNYQSHAPKDLPPAQYVEFSLSASFASYKLTAKFDLVAMKPKRQGNHR